MSIDAKERPLDKRTVEVSAKVKEELEQVKRRNELILQAAGEGIYGLDCEGITTFVNPAASQMLGWESEKLIGQPMHRLLHHSRPGGAHYPRQECPIYAAFKDGTVHHIADEVFWRKDGSSFPVEYTSTPIHEDGELAGAVVVFKDFNERKQAEQALMEAHAEVEYMKERLEAENIYLQEEIRSHHNFKEIIGQSTAIQQVLKQIELVAPTYASVLIMGESGTGKELFARAIHERSDRHNRPLIRVNCAAIPHDLFESEFFGHIKGAFTGAIKNRAGRFELADGGTIFLDEVGEIPLELQSKLLRVLQEGQFERVGEEKTCEVDVRVIAATNRDLAADVEAGKFRQDLFYRLNVFPLEAVPLRDRTGDIALLVQYFTEIVSNKLKRKMPKLTQGNIKQLQAYDWPGNIRELQNVIERAVIVSQDERLQFQLPGSEAPVAITHSEIAFSAHASNPIYTETERLAQDKANIEAALQQAKGKISGKDGAAELLGMKSTTLASRMKKLDIQKS
jgi:PAS domain S-box-containing protein